MKLKLITKMKLSRYKNYINVAEITEIVLSSKATTATTTSVSLTGRGLAYSIPTAFATATVCGSLSKKHLILKLEIKL